jgi:hypothetical protein
VVRMKAIEINAATTTRASKIGVRLLVVVMTQKTSHRRAD